MWPPHLSNRLTSSGAYQASNIVHRSGRSDCGQHQSNTIKYMGRGQGSMWMGGEGAGVHVDGRVESDPTDKDDTLKGSYK